MFSSKILTNRIIGAHAAEDMMHSTGYARVRPHDINAMSTADSKSFETRKSIDEQRKYVRGYKNSRIMNDFYGIRRAQASVLRPRAESGGRSGGQFGSQSGGTGTGRGAQPIDTAMRRAQFSVSAPRRFGKR